MTISTFQLFREEIGPSYPYRRAPMRLKKPLRLTQLGLDSYFGFALNGKT